MTIFLRRQIAATMANGADTALPDATVFPYRAFDVLPKIVLKLADGKFIQDNKLIAASASFSVALPESYSNANYLHISIRSNQPVKVTVVDVGAVSHTFAINATKGTTLGDHFGLFVTQRKTTSITIVCGTADALVDWCLFEIPDLSLAASFRTGNQAFGYVTGT